MYTFLLMIVMTFSCNRSSFVETDKDAINLAKSEISERIGEDVLKDRTFSATEENGIWKVKCTKNCSNNKPCKPLEAEVVQINGHVRKIQYGENIYVKRY